MIKVNNNDNNNLILKSNFSVNLSTNKTIPLSGKGKIVIKEKINYNRPKHKIKNDDTNNINDITNNINDINNINNNNNTKINENIQLIDKNDVLLPLPSYFRTVNNGNDDNDSNEKTLIQVKCYSGTVSIDGYSNVKITRIGQSAIFNDDLRPLTCSTAPRTAEIDNRLEDFNDDTSQESLAQRVKSQVTIKIVNKNEIEGKLYLDDITSPNIETVWPLSDSNHILVPASGPALADIKQYKMAKSPKNFNSVKASKLDLIEILDRDFLNLFDKKKLPPITGSVKPSTEPSPDMGDLIRTISAESLREKNTSPQKSSPQGSKGERRARPTSPMTDSTHEGGRFSIKKGANLDLYNTLSPNPNSAQVVGSHNRSSSPLYHPSSFRRPIKEQHGEYHFEEYDESVTDKGFSLDDIGGSIVKQKSRWHDDASGNMVNDKYSVSSSQSTLGNIPPPPTEIPELNKKPKPSSRSKKYNPVRIETSMDDDNVMTCAKCQSFSAYWCQKCLLSYCPDCWEVVDHHFPLELVITAEQAEDESISPHYSRVSTANSQGSDHGGQRSIASAGGGDGVSIKISKPKPVKYQDYPEPPIIMDSRGSIHQEKDFDRSVSRSPSRSAGSDRYRSESPDYFRPESPDYYRPESPGIYTYDPNQGGSRTLEGLSNSQLVASKKEPSLQARVQYLKSLENAKLDVFVKHYESKSGNEGLFEASRKAQQRAEETKNRLELIKQKFIEEQKKKKKEEKKKGKKTPQQKKKRKPKYIPPVAFAIDSGGCTICPQRQQPKHVRALKNYTKYLPFPSTEETVYPNDWKEVAPPIVQTFGAKVVYLKEFMETAQEREKKQKKLI